MNKHGLMELTCITYLFKDSKYFVGVRGAKIFSRGRQIVNMVNVTPLGSLEKSTGKAAFALFVSGFKKLLHLF